ncbi:hypothetical protein ABK040_014178 [Willaertia magna]
MSDSNSSVGLPLCFIIYPNYLSTIINNSTTLKRVSTILFPQYVVSQNDTVNNLISSNKLSMSTDSSESDFTFLDSKYIGIQRLRDSFENWLIETNGDLKGNFIFQKLLFLDEFYDPNKDKIRKVLNLEDLFASLNRFLFKIFKKQNILLDETEKYPYLINFKSCLQKLKSSCPILELHEDLLNYLIKKQNLLQSISNDKKKENEEIINLDDLQQLCFMFYLDIYNYFTIYQNLNSKFINQWISKELQNSPNYLIDNLQSRIKKFNNFKKNTKYNIEDFNLKYVIDNDFNFVKFLTKNTNDWKLHSQKYKDFTVWKSDNQSYTTIPNMRIFKINGYLNYSLENAIKSLFRNKTGASGDLMVNEKEFNYQSIQSNSSNRKYPTYLHEALFDFGQIFKNRTLHNIISVRATFIGEKVQEVIHFYKTCKLEEKDEKKNLKVITIGARIFNRLDANKTLFTDISLTNTKGVLNSKMLANLSISKLKNDTFQMFNHLIEEDVQKGNGKP